MLRLVVELEGEKVVGVDTHIGYLHRGTEKLMEEKTYMQGLPYLDRLDYTSMMSQEHTYSLAVEKLAGIEVPRRARGIRVVMLEVTRILNHLIAISCHALDVGAMTVYFNGFEEREKLMEIYERVSGARFHSAYIRPGGVTRDIALGTLEDIREVSKGIARRLDEIEELLTENRIWRERLEGVGVVGIEEARNRGFTGVMIRSSGEVYDMRRNEPYELYDEVEFKVVVGRKGDSYERYKVRVQEMRESVKIILDMTEKLEEGSVSSEVVSREEMKRSMEGMIRHFKEMVEGIEVREGEVYVGTESPKGEFGVYIRSEGGRKPSRVKFRSPGLLHIAGVEYMVKDHLLADLVTVIGSQDIVFGEIDR